MSFRLLIFMIAVFSSSADSYRFVCNGLLANGEERGDECGVCDIEHAARWTNANIPVVVDDSPLPEGVSQSDWQGAVNKSLQAWEDVSGSNLRFFRVNSDNKREFGANDVNHEIFWITSKEEWRKLVGTGEFGTLGATMPRYTCGGADGAKRTIFDADLVLNGMGHINWQVDCQDDDCISIQTTLVHELGHFFGLDHPCMVCSSSIMSARAGFDLIYPVFDDMQGVRALYPDGTSGSFGSPCADDHQCQNSHICVSDGPNRYCSTTCHEDSSCEEGAICRQLGAQKVCTFLDGESAGGRTLGESCSRVPCAEPYICAGASKDNYYCFMPCDGQQDCQASQSCIALSTETSLCVSIKQLGQACDHQALCDHGLFCVLSDLEVGSCREPCGLVNAHTTGCRSGEVCRLFEDRQELCIPQSDKLVLDGNADNFDGNSGQGGLGREGISAAASGCSQQPLSGCLWLFLALGLAWRLRRLDQHSA